MFHNLNRAKGSMMRSLKIGFSLSVITVLLFAHQYAMAEKPSVIMPDGALNAEQIKGQFTGKSTVAKVADKELAEVYYFAEDGSVIEARDGFQKTGKWYVRDDGRLCIDLKGEHRDCRLIIKEGNNYHQYAAKLDGNHRYEQTYSDFRHGNQLPDLSTKPLLPLGTLKKKQVIKLFSGQTVESVTASKSRVSHTYYAPDGAVLFCVSKNTPTGLTGPYFPADREPLRLTLLPPKRSVSIWRGQMILSNFKRRH